LRVSDHLWLWLFLLGAYHGINPGMGWLFAVALGLQERSARAVLRAVIPLTLGHVVSVSIVVLLAVLAALTFPHAIVHRAAAGVLLAFGVYRLVRVRHPRWVGMRVGFWGLALWGLLMSSAHGAGLMLLPFVTGSRAMMQGAMPMPGAMNGPYALGWLMVGVHTLGYVVTMTAVALVIYQKVGVSFLRSAWFNMDLVWAVALLVSGFIALMT
jgi:protein-S-isoprenylcysteine O-methyltransferase Ste14